MDGKQRISAWARDRSPARFRLRLFQLSVLQSHRGGNGVTTFTYDLYFWIDNVDAPQALEFDVNQVTTIPLAEVAELPCVLRGDRNVT